MTCWPPSKSSCSLTPSNFLLWRLLLLFTVFFFLPLSVYVLVEYGQQLSGTRIAVSLHLASRITMLLSYLEKTHQPSCEKNGRGGETLDENTLETSSSDMISFLVEHTVDGGPIDPGRFSRRSNDRYRSSSASRLPPLLRSLLMVGAS